MDLVYSIAPYSAPGGKDIVSNYPGTTLTKVNNNGTNLPAPGDIFSESGTAHNPYGHTGVIVSVSVTNGNGMVSIMEQNNTTSGINTINVSNNILQSSVTGWLHGTSNFNQPATGKVSALQYNSEMDIFKRRSDGAIWKDTYQPGSGIWGGWNSLSMPYSGGTFTSDPVAIQFNAEMDVYATASNGQLYKNTYQPSPGSWSGWNSLGSNMAGSPTAITYSGSEMDIFSRGTNNNLYRDTWNGSSWSGFTQISGNGSTAMASDPTVVLYGSELDVYIRGTDSNLWKSGYSGSSWGSLGSMGGGNLENNPVAIHYGSEMDIYSNNTSGTLIKDTWNGSSWSGWNSLTGASFAGSPTALQYGSGEMDVYDRGISDSHIYKDTWQSGGTSWSGWNSLGGIEAGDPTALQFSTEMDVFASNQASSDANNTDKDTWLPANNSWSSFQSLL